MVNKCKQCNAVVNPKWQKCIACGADLVINTPDVPITSDQDINSMSLSDFANKNLAVKVYSKLLGQEAWFVSNKEIMKQLEDTKLPIFLPEELQYLINRNPNADELRKIAMVKEVFYEGPAIICTKEP